MTDYLDQHLPQLVFWGTALSLATIVLTLVAVPWVLGRLPVDYFSTPRRHVVAREAGPGAQLLNAGKNLLGACLVALGIVQLFTPGQGLVTLMAGLLLMNFPGKYRLERAVVRRPGVLKAMNWLRRRQDLPPLEAPGPAATGEE